MHSYRVYIGFTGILNAHFHILRETSIMDILSVVRLNRGSYLPLNGTYKFLLSQFKPLQFAYLHLPLHCYYTQHVPDDPCIYKSFLDKFQYSRKMWCCSQQKDFHIILHKPEHKAHPWPSTEKIRERKKRFLIKLNTSLSSESYSHNHFHHAYFYGPDPSFLNIST
jgi:hypothetical protein